MKNDFCLIFRLYVICKCCNKRFCLKEKVCILKDNFICHNCYCIIDKMDVKPISSNDFRKLRNVIKFKGYDTKNLLEIPFHNKRYMQFLNVNPSTLDDWALDFPENLFCLSNSTPIDLKPTQEKKPL